MVFKKFKFDDIENFYLSASIDHDPFIRNIFTPLLLSKGLVITKTPLINIIENDKLADFINKHNIGILFYYQY